MARLPRQKQRRAPEAEESAAGLKPGVVLGADLEGVLVNVSKWSGTGGLGGAFTRLFDNRLQRIAELKNSQKLRRQAEAVRRLEGGVAGAPAALQRCEKRADELQSRKEGIHAKLQQLEAQQQSVLQPAVTLLQQHEPGPDLLVDGLAIAPVLSRELDRLQATEELLEQGVLRLGALSLAAGRALVRPDREGRGSLKSCGGTRCA